MQTVEFTKGQYLTDDIFPTLRKAKEIVLNGMPLMMEPVESGFEFEWKRIEHNPLRHLIVGYRLRKYLEERGVYVGPSLLD